MLSGYLDRSVNNLDEPTLGSSIQTLSNLHGPIDETIRCVPSALVAMPLGYVTLDWRIVT
jgi:hypothetical protein